ncbi:MULTISPECIES: heavy metal translocating P-type ATPase [unclassified Rhizobium]|uniref:heavy metal translocating P-type ATPase n=1 Tax=unclassified Rhizobium TaxID=2613769 RepID=UPI001FCD5246|nr:MULTISPECIES: heavy metal translocating P-type ATPase [unclassified Rhizobium]
MLLAGLALTCLSIGGFLYLSDAMVTAHTAWSVGALAVLAVLLFDMVRALLSGRIGVDAIAALAIGTALVLGESLAAAIVSVMYAGGQLLESFAEGRARRDMSALLGRVARTAMVHRGDTLVAEPIESLAPSDIILLRRGEVVPVDGRLLAAGASLDMSALTGEPTPVTLKQGCEVPSGATVVGDAFDLLVLRGSAASTYAGIVRLVEQAQASRSPMARLADRYALYFLGLTLCLAGGAFAWSGDPARALAVLVVATPCPLILAVPVAVISGMSRAAAQGVLVKTASALEALAAVSTVVLDKTGTVTSARPEVGAVLAGSGFTEAEVLRLAASLDQASGHVAAEALVRAALDQGLPLSLPQDVVEHPGQGLLGLVDSHSVVLGGSGFVSRHLSPGEVLSRAELPPGAAVVAVSVDGKAAGHILLTDPVRQDAADAIAAFRAFGINRIVMASGDRSDVAEAAAATLHLDAVKGDLTAPDKVDLVLKEKRTGIVMMVGDGVNDAPALATADVGVAISVRGSAASSEAADAVLLADDLGRLPLACTIARRSRRIARQSAGAGVALSGAAMVCAAVGLLSPVQGALLQEVIDVAVILNALRALRA